jgi:alkanesulfonate monooxygenase SsuD/methylene tetrahydromethanopterin reductase-like flavin-dependent oxidoreductase (luciferase family)
MANRHSLLEMKHGAAFRHVYRVPEPPGANHHDLIWDHIEVGVQADQLGFDVFTCLEHQWFDEFAVMTDPLQLFAILSQRTRNLRFRTLCHTLPLHNPMVLAGQIALVRAAAEKMGKKYKTGR